VKTITTGEGGAVTTNSDEFADGLRRFRHHGIQPRPEEGGWVYDIPNLGFNYRLTDLQAALGASQLDRLDAFVARRNELATRYRTALEGSAVVCPPGAPPGYLHGYHLFVVQVAQRRQVYDAMRDAGIGVQVNFVPTYRFSVYAGDQDPPSFPVTEDVYAGILSLPMFPGLTDEQQDFVVDTLLSVVGR
jgi:dTDP-4-amino-4,6-dideoxygalactose transaminase